MEKYLLIADKGREQPAKFLNDYNIYPNLIEVRIEQINNGDYLISRGTKLLAIIERKTWADLADSIKDRSRRENHQRLLKARADTGCRIVYIIEGAIPHDFAKLYSGIPVSALLARLDHIAFRDNCLIIQTIDPRNTAERLIMLTKNLSTLKSPTPDSPPTNTPTDTATDAVEASGGSESVPTAASEPGDFAKSPDYIATQARKSCTNTECAAKMFAQLPGVSEVTAKALLRAGVTPRAIVGGESAVETLAEIGVGAKKLGLKKATKMCVITNSIAAEMLAEIDGVTPILAEHLVNTHTPPVLFKSTQEELSAFTRPTGVKLGKALSTRIFNVLGCIE